MTAAVQARIDLVALEGGVARFGSGPTAHAVAVLDVVGADASMASADVTTKDELLAGWAPAVTWSLVSSVALVCTRAALPVSKWRSSCTAVGRRSWHVCSGCARRSGHTPPCSSDPEHPSREHSSAKSRHRSSTTL